MRALVGYVVSHTIILTGSTREQSDIESGAKRLHARDLNVRYALGKL